jgi:hypothetical protein
VVTTWRARVTRVSVVWLCFHTSVSQLELQRRECERKTELERVREFEAHVKWLALVDQIALAKAAADSKAREVQRLQDTIGCGIVLCSPLL